MARPRRPDKATPAASSKASRIRKRLDLIARGDRTVIVTRDERAFLKAHEEKYPYTKRRRRELEHDAPAASSPADGTGHSHQRERDPAPPASSPPPQPEKRYTVDFSEPPAKLNELQAPPEKEESGCSFGKDCPHCRDGIAKKDHVLGKCGTTGKVVYEPMSEQGARFFAGTILNGMALAARILRPDHALIEPEDEDYEDMTRGVRMTIDRRLPQLSAWDDLAQLGFAFGAFGRRALFESTAGAAAEEAHVSGFVWRDMSHADLAETGRQFRRLGLHTGALDNEMRRRIAEEPPPAPPNPLPPLHVEIADYGYVEAR